MRFLVNYPPPNNGSDLFSRRAVIKDLEDGKPIDNLDSSAALALVIKPPVSPWSFIVQVDNALKLYKQPDSWTQFFYFNLKAL